MGEVGVSKSLEYPIQILSLEAIKVDRSLQSRVKTSLEYQREFSDAMLQGTVFPPVVVFFDGTTYWLADGFHRVGAAKQVAKFDPTFRGIRAEVRPGSYRDALIYSTGANKAFSIPRTDQDKRKAVEMLLDDPETFRWSLNRIADHVGVKKNTVQRWRTEFCFQKNIEPPSEVESKNGTVYPARIGKKKGRRAEWFRNRGDTSKSAETSTPVLNPSDIQGWLSRRKLFFQSFGTPGPWPDASGLFGHGCVCTICDFARGQSFSKAIGNVLLLREYQALQDPQMDRTIGIDTVVICYRDQVPNLAKTLAERLGVQLLAPLDLVNSIIGDPKEEPPFP